MSIASRTNLMLAAAASGIAAATTSLSASQEAEVLIVEDWRPTGTWRAFGGTCGEHRYEVTIDVGKRPLASSVRDAKVDGRSHRASVHEALQSAKIEGAIVDATIDRCETDRARIQLDVVQPGPPPNLRPHYLWLGSDGRLELVRER